MLIKMVVCLTALIRKKATLAQEDLKPLLQSVYVHKAFHNKEQVVCKITIVMMD
jgi:hypothetical protein